MPALARQLKRVFKFDESAAEQEEMDDCDSRVLQKIVDNLASWQHLAAVKFLKHLAQLLSAALQAKFCVEIWSSKQGEETKARDVKSITGKALACT